MKHRAQPSESPLFSHHFDAFCDSLLYRPTATRNPFVSYNIERLSPNPGQMTIQNQWEGARNLAFV